MKYKKFVEAQKVEVDDEDKTMVDTKKKNTDKKGLTLGVQLTGQLCNGFGI